MVAARPLADDAFTAERFQLVIDGDRVALLCSNNKGGWIRRGTLDRDGPHLAPAFQFATSTARTLGSRIVRESDAVYLPLAGDPPGLLVAALDDLLTEHP